jgi:hypothetical protein
MRLSTPNPPLAVNRSHPEENLRVPPENLACAGLE